MSVHHRKVIRDAVVAHLVAGNTIAEERVKASRRWPWRMKDLPAIAVYQGKEVVDPESRLNIVGSSRELTRMLPVVIEAAVRVTDDIDDVLDAVALEIERVMHADETLGGVAGDSLLVATEFDIDEDGADTAGVVTLTYQVTYRTLAPDFDAGRLGSFKKAHIRTNIENQVHPSNEAVDDVLVEGAP